MSAADTSQARIRAAAQHLAEVKRGADLARQDHVNARIQQHRDALNPRHVGQNRDIGTLHQPPKPWWSE